MIVQTIELDSPIMSVGLVKPPYGFFTGLKSDHMLLLGCDHTIVGCEISFTNQYNRGRTTHINRLDIKIECENITHDRIVYSSNSRIFVGCRDAKLNELKFSSTKAWFSKKITKCIAAEDRQQTSWFWKIVPKIFTAGRKDIAKIAIDDSRHIVYTLAFREFDETEDIRPCSIEIFYLGAFGEGFVKVTSISQLELSKHYKQFSNSNDSQPLQVVGLHYISVSESSDVHFMLVTSTGQRIYISLDVKEYITEKMRDKGNVDYTAYFKELPNGEWKIAGITNPPLPKDITGRPSDDINCCAEIGFNHTELCVIKSSYEKGCVFMNGINRSTNRKVLLYINDSETFIKSKHELNTRNGATEKFWAMQVGENKYLLDIRNKPLELYIDEDILNVIGYFKRRPTTDNIAQKKTKHNEYSVTRKHIYSEQVYLPGEEFLIMQNTEIYTMIKKRPIDELFTILYIAQLPNTNMSEEINAFLDDHGTKETCSMLLQIICNPNDHYQLNLRYAKKNTKFQKGSSYKGYMYTPKSKYEEQKGYGSEDEASKEVEKSSDVCEIKSPNENLVEYAKSLFYKISNTFPSYPTSRDYSMGLYAQRASLANNLATKESEVQSIKLSSLFLYLSRILQPIFKNYLVYMTSLNKNAEHYPNMGVSEKRVCGAKLQNLFTFIKNEEKLLKKLNREEKDTRDYRKDYGYETSRYDTSLNYENVIHQEAEQIDHLKAFIFRCIIAVEFLEEISKVPKDFSSAIKMMSDEDKRILETFQFRDLTQDITHDTAFKSFVKKLLEVKAESCHDLKEAKRMCETWNKKCGVFIDKEFINVFIAEYQLNKMLESKSMNEEILAASLRELRNYPMRFEVEKVVYLLIRLKKVKELVRLLCVRFLFIQEYEDQESRYASTRENPIKFDHSYYRNEENLCIGPILEILGKVYDTYVEKIKKTSSSLDILGSFLDYKKEITIYDYLQDEYLKNFTIQSLIELKTDLIESVLLHDNERLHNIILSWMIEKELYEDLEKVTSKYYDKFNEKLEKQSCLNTHQISLVYKYLIKMKHYERVIHFLIPLIFCNTNDENCKVKGECTVKHRLQYLDIAQSACHEAARSITKRQELDSIMKTLDGCKNTLIIQSNIENILLKLLKENLPPSEQKRISSKLVELNSKVFDLDELKERITKPMKLYDLTINILFNKVLIEEKITKEIELEVEECYCNILSFYSTDLRAHYPRM